MKGTCSFMHSLTSMAFVLAAFVMVPSSAFTQQVSEDQAVEVMEEVVKVEVLVTSRFVGCPNELGARTEVFELRKTVSLADLDLRKVADVGELEKRIENTAEKSCKALSEINPIQLWSKADHRRCVREAIESTDSKIETLFAAIR